MQQPKPRHIQAVPDTPERNKIAARPFRRPLAEIMEDLRRPVPPQYIKHKNKGGARLSFVPWYDIVRLLEARAPGFEYDCEPHFDTKAGKTVVKATITIHGSDGSLSRSALGIEESDLDGWGDPTSNASSMALRRAAAIFGLALHLYYEK